MAEYEVSVRAFRHITVEADSAEEAEDKALSVAGTDLSYDWTVEEADTGEPL